MESYLALKNISVEINKKTIINVDGFSLKEGEIVGLAGENGAGKSTLLRVLALLEKPSKGEVLFKGRVAQDFQNLRQKMALVFQDSLLFRGTVYKNVSYPLKLRKYPKLKIDALTKKVLVDFSIEHLAQQDVRTLSGGEAKRVCLARALVYEPSILFLDEPFNSLDLIVRRKIETLLFSYLKANSITAIFVSHNFEELLRRCSRLAVMHQGRLVQFSPVDEIIKAPVNKFVADILGNTSFIEAEIKSVDNELAIINVANHEFSVASHFPPKLANGQKVFLNLRPEDIFISENGAFKNSSVRNSYKAKIIRIDKSGAICKLQLESGFLSEVFITKQSVEEMDLVEGKMVVAGFKATAAKLVSSED
jgi:molybdopterin-binding protein